MWQEGEGGSKTWEYAITYYEGFSLGGYSDWRLPNIKELKSIVDNTTYNPSINGTYFPNTNSSSYWSFTTRAEGSSDVWNVGFYDGGVNTYGKSSSYDVRCVRAGQ